MKNRVRSLLLVSLFVVLALGLVACEKERPAPQAAVTRAAETALPASGAGAAAGTAGQGTALPATPIALQPGAAGSETPQAGISAESKNVSWNYTVQTGDTLPALASKYNVTRDAIVALNPDINPDVLATGQELRMPGEPPAGYKGYINYTVQSGDTLNQIAKQFGTTPQELQDLNDINDPDLVVPGQVLKVKGEAPAGAQPAAGTGTGDTTTTGATTTYAVQSGDTLAKIAARFDTTVSNLVKLNGLNNANSIYRGQVLKVPAAGGATTAATPAASGSTSPGTAQTYTVQAGDTLAKIATRYGVTVRALMNANNISNADLIQVGQVLKIP